MRALEVSGTNRQSSLDLDQAGASRPDNLNVATPVVSELDGPFVGLAIPNSLLDTRVDIQGVQPPRQSYS